MLNEFFKACSYNCAVQNGSVDNNLNGAFSWCVFVAQSVSVVAMHALRSGGFLLPSLFVVLRAVQFVGMQVVGYGNINNPFLNPYVNTCLFIAGTFIGCFMGVSVGGLVGFLICLQLILPMIDSIVVFIKSVSLATQALPETQSNIEVRSISIVANLIGVFLCIYALLSGIGFVSI